MTPAIPHTDAPTPGRRWLLSAALVASWAVTLLVLAVASGRSEPDAPPLAEFRVGPDQSVRLVLTDTAGGEVRVHPLEVAPGDALRVDAVPGLGRGGAVVERGEQVALVRREAGRTERIPVDAGPGDRVQVRVVPGRILWDRTVAGSVAARLEVLDAATGEVRTLSLDPGDADGLRVTAAPARSGLPPFADLAGAEPLSRAGDAGTAGSDLRRRAFPGGPPEPDTLPPGVTVETWDCPRLVRSRFRFTWEDAEAEPLARLRREADLDAVAAGPGDDVAAAARVMSWVRGRWRPGPAGTHLQWDGPAHLARWSPGEEGGGAAHYCQLLVQGLVALGRPARYIGYPHHEAVEVWSDDHRRWVLLDPLHDTTWSRDGEPLSALDLAREVRAGTVARLQATVLPGGPGLGEIARLCERPSWSFVNDHLTRGEDPEVSWAARAWRRVHALHPWSDAPPVTDGLVRPFTQFQEDLYFPVRTTAVTRVEPAGDRALRLRFATESPWFGGFEVRTDGEAWRDAGRDFHWSLRPGRNTLRVRVRSRTGLRGATSVITVTAAGR